MVIKSNNWLAHITINVHIIITVILCSLFYVYIVCISMYSLISNCHTIGISFFLPKKLIILPSNWLSLKYKTCALSLCFS